MAINLGEFQIGKKNNFPKPGIWMDGGIHAREWVSPATVLYMIDQVISILFLYLYINSRKS